MNQRILNEAIISVIEDKNNYSSYPDGFNRSDLILKALKEAETGIHIENYGEDPDHTLYGFDGSPLRTLECSCERCLDYFSNPS